MEMEVMIPSPAVDFNFDSTCTTPYMSAPSSPQRFGNFYFSAPTSPTRSTSFYREFNDFSLIADGDTTTTNGGSLSKIPFKWEEKPGIPKTKNTANINEDTDFEFDFSGQLDRTSLSADELFDGGKIKPLKPPPRFQFGENGFNDSPKSPRSPISTKTFKEALSPRHRKRDIDPFAAAIERTREQTENQQRGRERTYNSSASSIRHKGTRSLSPFRVCDLLFEHENNQQSENSSTTTTTKHSSSSSSSSSSFSASTSTSTWWKLKDFFLFRSASEGRATSKDSLKKYALLNRAKTSADDVKNSSFRSTGSVGSVSSSRKRGPGSAHELHYHYTVNRAVSEEMKKKTFLPYNRGLLGCLGFNPAVHEISKSFGSLTRG